LVDGSADKVGIGITPTQKLHIDGNALISSEKYYHTGGTGAGFGSDASSNIKIKQNGSDLVFGSGDNIGIGTSTPTEKLNVKGNIALSGASASAGPHLKLEGTYTTWELENQYTGGATNDMFRIRNTATSSDALVINRLTNNVGIGTTGPGETLTVSGNISADGHITTQAISVSSTSAGFVSAGRDLADIFAQGSSAIDGSGTANRVVAWCDTNTIGASNVTTTELNCLDGLTSTTTELNLLDGSSANTVVNSKAAIYGSGGELAGTLSTAAQTNITSLGTLTCLIIDDITINGSTISDADELTIDAEGDITLDANGGDIRLKDAGTEFGRLANINSNLVICSRISDEDIIFCGNDGGVDRLALTLDMSDSGAAVFNHKACMGDGKLVLNGTAVTSTAAELNCLDGLTSTTTELNCLDGLTSTTAELNCLDGLTSTTAELNCVDGLTSTTAELNTLDGFTGDVNDLNYAKDLKATGVTTTEFDCLDGLTSTTTELNKLDGVTSSTAELNCVDGLTSTTAELNTLDGFTGSVTDLNYAKDLRATGVTDTEFNCLDGLTSTTTELNKLDGVTSTTC
jgi:hypothetical protein